MFVKYANSSFYEYGFIYSRSALKLVLILNVILLATETQSYRVL